MKYKCKREMWVPLVKIMGFDKSIRNELKKFERGFVSGSEEMIVIYDLNEESKKYLGGLQCEILELTAAAEVATE